MGARRPKLSSYRRSILAVFLPELHGSGCTVTSLGAFQEGRSRGTGNSDIRISVRLTVDPEDLEVNAE